MHAAGVGDCSPDSRKGFCAGQTAGRSESWAQRLNAVTLLCAMAASSCWRPFDRP